MRGARSGLDAHPVAKVLFSLSYTAYTSRIRSHALVSEGLILLLGHFLGLDNVCLCVIYAALNLLGYTCKASYTGSLRPHTLVA